mmetsp:Transcript_11418/g.28903  ORF Transcript_11418/g.28903 Transcript_11418/m.28903 type:complete len:202 (+) Transcript_11418:719-1324(+)
MPPLQLQGDLIFMAGCSGRRFGLLRGRFSISVSLSCGDASLPKRLYHFHTIIRSHRGLPPRLYFRPKLLQLWSTHNYEQIMSTASEKQTCAHYIDIHHATSSAGHGQGTTGHVGAFSATPSTKGASQWSKARLPRPVAKRKSTSEEKPEAECKVEPEGIPEAESRSATPTKINNSSESRFPPNLPSKSSRGWKSLLGGRAV